MKIAVIPPAGLLLTTVSEPVHMIIPEGLRVRAYRDFYAIQGKMNKTIMLDNGAYEGEGGKPLDNDHLTKYIYDYGVDIFALPDRMGNMHETLEGASRFLHYWEIYHLLINPPPIQFMAVIQGADVDEMKRCVEGYCAMEKEHETSFIFALSKWTTHEMYQEIRVAMAHWITSNMPHPIHLFGMSSVWPREILYAAQALPDAIISIDTAAPFTYAMSDLKLGGPVLVRRPRNYFGADMSRVDGGLVRANLETIRSWASGHEA